jgi:hypothetical protein
MLAPMLVQMERQIDREIAADNKANGVSTQTDTEMQTATTGTETEEFDSEDEEDDDNGAILMYGPQPQIVTNDLKSLDEMVSENQTFIYCGLFITTKVCFCDVFYDALLAGSC